MSRDSLTAAKTELLTALTTGGNVGSVTGVYGFEPAAGQMARPTAVTISTAGMDSDYYHLAVRVYSAADVDAADAQTTLDTLIFAVEGRMGSGFGPIGWTVDYSGELNAFVAVATVLVGREDHL